MYGVLPILLDEVTTVGAAGAREQSLGMIVCDGVAGTRGQSLMMIVCDGVAGTRKQSLWMIAYGDDDSQV
jgi:hypothetical protein